MSIRNWVIGTVFLKVSCLLVNRGALKGTMVALAMSTIASLNGVFIILNYTETTFEKAGSTLSPSTSSIAIALVQIIGCTISVILMDRFGRKVTELL